MTNHTKGHIRADRTLAFGYAGSLPLAMGRAGFFKLVYGQNTFVNCLLLYLIYVQHIWFPRDIRVLSKFRIAR
jgi:hypothetical protein